MPQSSEQEELLMERWHMTWHRKGQNGPDAWTGWAANATKTAMVMMRRVAVNSRITQVTRLQKKTGLGMTYSLHYQVLQSPSNRRFAQRADLAKVTFHGHEGHQYWHISDQASVSFTLSYMKDPWNPPTLPAHIGSQAIVDDYRGNTSSMTPPHVSPLPYTHQPPPSSSAPFPNVSGPVFNPLHHQSPLQAHQSLQSPYSPLQHNHPHQSPQHQPYQAPPYSPAIGSSPHFAITPPYNAPAGSDPSHRPHHRQHSGGTPLSDQIGSRLPSHSSISSPYPPHSPEDDYSARPPSLSRLPLQHPPPSAYSPHSGEDMHSPRSLGSAGGAGPFASRLGGGAGSLTALGTSPLGLSPDMRVPGTSPSSDVSYPRPVRSRSTSASASQLLNSTSISPYRVDLQNTIRSPASLHGLPADMMGPFTPSHPSYIPSTATTPTPSVSVTDLLLSAGVGSTSSSAAKENPIHLSSYHDSEEPIPENFIENAWEGMKLVPPVIAEESPKIAAMGRLTFKHANYISNLHQEIQDFAPTHVEPRD